MYSIYLTPLIVNKRYESASEEGRHTLRAAKNNFSEHCFQTITSTIVVIFSQEQ